MGMNVWLPHLSNSRGGGGQLCSAHASRHIYCAVHEWSRLAADKKSGGRGLTANSHQGNWKLLIRGHQEAHQPALPTLAPVEAHSVETPRLPQLLNYRLIDGGEVEQHYVSAALYPQLLILIVLEAVDNRAGGRVR
jgi:hypothetical protein